MITNHHNASLTTRVSFVYFYYPRYDTIITTTTNSDSNNNNNNNNDKLKYNTIFDSEILMQNSISEFGDLILSKWKKVQNVDVTDNDVDDNKMDEL